MFPFAGGRFGKHCGPGGPGGRHGHGPFGHFGAELLEDLDLTDEQVEKIAELKADGMSEGMRMMAEGGQAFKGLMREILKEDLNKEKVREAHKKLQEHKIKMGEAMLERALSFAETLTPEQRKKLKRSTQRRFLGLDGDRRGGGPGFGPGFGFGPGPGGGGGRHDR
jgi:Spy/CpxP family protein refolding chaperone